MTTQNQLLVTLQQNRIQYVKINLLNFKFQTVDELSGVINSVSTTEDANADLRRTCSVDMVVTDSSFNVEFGGKIWLDKYIQIFLGIENNRTKEIEWFNNGIYLIDSPSYFYSGDSHTLSFQGLDLMSKLTGLRNGQLEGLPNVIPYGENIRTTMIAILKEAGFNRYIIEDNPQEVPYEIQINVGGTVADLLYALRDITPEYEIFFDVDGTFIYQKRPQGHDEPVIINDEIWNDMLLDYSISTDFTKVKNYVEVWGKSHDPIYFGDIATNNGNTYEISIPRFPTNLETEFTTTIGFVTTEILNNPYLKINDHPAMPIVNDDGSTAIIPDKNAYYVVRYDDGKYRFLGYKNAYGVAYDDNPQSPFYIHGTLGKVRVVKSGGQYENIWSNELAKQRAQYELYLHSQMNDQLTINCVPIPYLEVNKLISFTLPNEKISKKYIIKYIGNVHTETGVQTITMMRYYPLYPEP